MTQQPNKLSISLDELVWANRAAEHLRDGCAECRAGGCISSALTTPDCYESTTVIGGEE